MIYRLRSATICLAVLVLVFVVSAFAFAANGAVTKGGKTRQAAPSAVKGLGADKADDTGGDFLSLGTTDEKKTDSSESPGYVTALNFIFMLVLVCALAYGTVYALKRFSSLRGPLGPGRKQIRVLENGTLGPNRALHLVEVGSRKFLVASTPSAINLICELQEADLPEVAAVEPPVDFKGQLATLLGTKKDGDDAAKSVAQMLRESSSFFSEKVVDVAKMRGRLRNAGQ